MDITVNGLEKRYGENRVLTGFTAIFPAGETTCIMGPSGCGKTTLLNIMMGLDFADGGEVRGVPRLMSAVFQEDRLLEGFNAESNIRFVCGKKTYREEIAEHLERIGLAGEHDKPVRNFSGGMRRRVAVVRAVLAKSEILFLDEPFKGLDEKTKLLTMQYVRDNIAGRTVIIVTHSLDEAQAFGGRLINMPVRNETGSQGAES